MHIAIIEDHVLVSELLSQSLLHFQYADRVSVFNSGIAFLESAPEGIDVIILDILMPGMGGIALLEHIRKIDTEVKIVVLTTIQEHPTIRHVLSNGANAYLHKGIDIGELKEAIDLVLGGGVYISKQLQSSFIESVVFETRADLKLSPQQKEVLKRIASNRSAKEIAFEMNLSVQTVYTYIKVIMKKLNVNRLPDLVSFAMRSGLV